MRVAISLEGREKIAKPYRYVVLCRTGIELPSYRDRITLGCLESIGDTPVTACIDIPDKGIFIPGLPGHTGRGNVGFRVSEISGIATKRSSGGAMTGRWSTGSW
ncbi:hypothetical protein J8I87_17465 [Paraburkholderia sp. LEh10]|uniref:hypothetical protein n=1 Tax=Paraburkholderia sp. LEh10 TaxID=2821353 RepID=UPI001AE20F50|nr:hypothetical protein [Paraburkholderia sp. LEh10]MBP0591479.1 hypothetical protein [Paraburkholderia sp. LEh10]